MIRRADLPRIALRFRDLSELLLHPCKCGQRNCTTVEHLWRSTKDMEPGPRAQNTDPDGRGWRYEEIEHPNGDVELMPVALDATGEAAITAAELADHDEYRDLLQTASDVEYRLVQFIDRRRPDRIIRDLKTNDEDFCAHHMRTIGKREPFYRRREDQGKERLCRTCYNFAGAYKVLPPESLLQAKHEARRWTDRMIADALREVRGNKRKKRSA